MCRSSGTRAARSSPRSATRRLAVTSSSRQPATAPRTSTTPTYQDATGKNWFSYDSGAILVGAGNAPGCKWGNDPTVARGRLSFSNYGSRLDLQGWGDCVTTTAYGDLQGSPGGSAAYTELFSGTSSASPIVAAGAALVSSIAESRGSTLTPATVRSTLKSTGQAQAATGNPGNIGPLPNVKAAVGALGPKLAESAHLSAARSSARRLCPSGRAGRASGSAAAQYDVRLSTDGGAYVKQTLASPESPPPSSRWRRTTTTSSPPEPWTPPASGATGAYGTKFSLGQYQENYSTTNPAFTGAWARSAWQPASGGYLNVSATAGDKATFSFTGSNVAWIATKATNRVQAKVYVDGVAREDGRSLLRDHGRAVHRLQRSRGRRPVRTRSPWRSSARRIARKSTWTRSSG